MTRADIERDPTAYIQHIEATLVATSDKLDSVAATVDQHTITLADHTAKLNALKRTQDAMAEIQSEHTTMLKEILRRLPEPEGSATA